MAGYVIGSDKGKQIASNLKAGATYKASDGSTWKKNNDGSVSVTTKNGGYTANALQSSNVNTNTTGGTSSSGSSKTNSTNKTSNTIKTNTSYGGDFLTIDANTDYQALINQSVSSGDYNNAAYYEALRNAKLSYLNRGNEATNNYVSVYTPANGNGTNNQGGTAYDSKFNSFADLGDNWTAANIKGIKYTRDSNGNIYQGGRLAGNGYNPTTNSLTYSNRDDAVKAAYDQYISTGGDNVGMQYAIDRGLIDSGYIDALMEGTTGSYSENISSAAKAERDRQRLLALQARNNSFEDDDDDEPITPEEEVVLNENSFETDLTDNYSNYLNSISNRLRSQRMNRY